MKRILKKQKAKMCTAFTYLSKETSAREFLD
jgi:hypothetical protein